MAIAHHKSSVSLLILSGLTACIPAGAWAQNQPTSKLQTRLDVQAMATHTSMPQPGATGGDDALLSAAPSFTLLSKGAHTAIDAQWRFTFLDYLRNTQPDRVLPSGKLSVRVFDKSGPGVDMSVEASQVKSTPAAQQSITPDTQNSYTNATYRVSPFIERNLDNQTQFAARIDRQLLHTTQLSAMLAPRPDSLVRNDVARLSRRPTPLGYGLEWHQQETRVADQSTAPLSERISKATALYAPAPDVSMGLSISRGHNLIGGQTVTETTHGLQAQWRPTERSTVKGEIENRYFGRSWTVDLSHRSPWLALGLNADRNTSTYASTIGNVNAGNSLRGLYDAILTTRIPDQADRRQAVDSLIARRNLSSQTSPTGDIYDVAAQLRQTTTGRIALMGRRDIVSLLGGLIRTTPLSTPNTVGGLNPSIKQHFLDTQINHQLTPTSTIAGGLRWDRTWTSQPGLTQDVYSSSFSWRVALNTALTPETTATMGFNRQITHNPSTTTSDESAMFVGLGHRF